MSCSRLRRFLVVSAVGASLATTAACGGSAEEPSGTEPSGAESSADAAYAERGPIVFARAKDNTGYATKEVAAWNEAHPDEKVTLQDLPDSADLQRQQIIQNAQIKSDTISVVTTDVVWTAEFAANGYIDELPADQLSTEGYLESAVKAGTYFGKLYAAPGFPNGGLLYYRKDLLDAAGLAAPTTWQQMKEACAKIKSEPKNAKLDCYAGQFDKYEGLTVNFSEAVNTNGGSIVDDSGKPVVNSPEAVAGLNRLVEGFNDGTIPKEAITWKEEEGRQAFQQGELIFLRNWSYVYSLASKKDGSSKVAGKFDVTVLPGIDGPGVSDIGGLNWAIPKYAKNKGTALEFIKFLSAPEQQKQRFLQSGNPPAIADLYREPDVVAAYPYAPTLEKAIETGIPRPAVVPYGDVTLAIQEAAYGSLQGQKSAEDSIAELQTKLESLIQ